MSTCLQHAYGGNETAERALGGDFFNGLCRLNCGAADRFPYILNACIKSNFSSSRLVDGACRLLTPVLLNTLAKTTVRDRSREADCLREFPKRGALLCGRCRLLAVLDD